MHRMAHDICPDQPQTCAADPAVPWQTEDQSRRELQANRLDVADGQDAPSSLEGFKQASSSHGMKACVRMRGCVPRWLSLPVIGFFFVVQDSNHPLLGIHILCLIHSLPCPLYKHRPLRSLIHLLSSEYRDPTLTLALSCTSAPLIGRILPTNTSFHAKSPQLQRSSTRARAPS
jgi:hypothetical protein